MKKKESFKADIKTVYIGFMRMITLNFKLFGKPTQKGWKREISDKGLYWLMIFNVFYVGMLVGGFIIIWLVKNGVKF